MRKTKIICTIGPAVSSKEGIKSLIDAGMDVCRLNFSHGTHEDHGKIIQYVKELRENLHRPLSLLLDTKGPEVRTKNTNDLYLEEEGVYPLHGEIGQGGICIAPKVVLGDLKNGDRILFDDGIIQGVVVDLGAKGFQVKIKTSGTLKPNKSVNFPGVKLSIPCLTEKDKEDILFGVKSGVEAIAASFATSAEHILSIKELLRNAKAPHILVFAKIESLEGIRNFTEILEVSDGIMVARGDLAVECSFAQVPPMQKMMIEACNLKGKPVIVATQMLESMVQSRTPTRAEVSDVANSVFDGTSCTMLSSETAVGKHPAHTVSVMCEIIIEAEKAVDQVELIKNTSETITSKIAASAVGSATDLNAVAILVFSQSGKTARMISSLRPSAKVIVVTPEKSTFHQSAFLYGACAMIEKKGFDHTDLNNGVMSRLLQRKWVEYGDLIVITMGVPFGVSFTTNTVRIESVGNAILRGEKMEKKEITPVCGEVIYYFPRGDREHFDFSGKIIITSEFFTEMGDLFKEAKGIILQNVSYDKASEFALKEFSLSYNVPYITRVEGAMSLLKEGDNIRLEPSIGQIFSSNAPTYDEMIKA